MLTFSLLTIESHDYPGAGSRLSHRESTTRSTSFLRTSPSMSVYLHRPESPQQPFDNRNLSEELFCITDLHGRAACGS